MCLKLGLQFQNLLEAKPHGGSGSLRVGLETHFLFALCFLNMDAV